MEALWGIDLGGTKIEGIVIDTKPPYKVHARKRIPTYREKGYENILNRIKLLVEELINETETEPEIIGFGTPGKVDPVTSKIQNSNTVVLNNQPFKRDIENVLNVPVTIANDANCFALAETRIGIISRHYPDARNVFGIIMGSGVGGGLIINGNILYGKHGIAGEWGHNFLDESGGECYCGKTGCVETVISGKALEKYYFQHSGMKYNLPEISQLRYEDADAQATIERLHYYFGKAVANVINIVDPDVIIIGGGVGNIDSLYTEGVEAAKPFLFNNTLTTHFAKPLLGDSAGVFGAAFLTEEDGV